VQRLRLGVALLVLALVVVNLFGRHIGGRLDLTPGKAYTLSRATKQLAGRVPDLVTIRVFASSELPAEVALIQRDVRDVLSDYRAAGKGKIRVVYADPGKDSTARNEARNLGIPSVQFNVVGRSELQVKEGYLGLAVQYAGQSKTIPFIQRTDDLEYRLTSFLRALTVKDRPRVLLGTPAEDAETGNTFQQLRDGLSQNYELRTLFFGADSAELEGVKVLVVAGSPDSLSAVQKRQLSEFLSKGGSALIMAGGMRLPERTFFAIPRTVAWNELLKPYGVTVRSDMVYDLISNERVAMPAQFGRILMQYPYWVRALSTHRSPINEEMDGIFLPWSSSLDTSGARAGTLTPLFVTSRAAGVSVGQVFIEPNQRFATDSLSPRLMAVQVNPLAGDTAAGPRGRVVVFGSSDFASDRNIRNAPENLSAALNAVDWLAQDESLITIRAKDRTPPPLVFSSDLVRDGVKYGNLIGMPVILIAVAGVRLWRRRQLARRPYRAAEPAPEAA
jgi:ABC-type uncharacterized transport system involved in gliding motility auxiliary subunit